MSILVNRPDNQRRPADWRWQRAGELCEGGTIVRGRDDDGVQFATKFRRMIDRCQNDDDLLEALDAHPEMFDAYSIYNSQETPTELRWELEARMLAAESPASIECKTGITPSVQALYGRVFFDVADRLKSSGLITHVIIGRAVQTGLSEREYDCLWKLFGYWMGPAVLDAFIYKFNCPKHTENHDGLRAALREMTKDTIMQKGAVTMMTMKVNWQTAEQIMILWNNVLQLEVQAGQAGSGSEVLLQNITVLTDQFRGLIHKHIPDVSEGPTGLVAELEASGARLRAAELAAIGMGERPTGLEYLMNAKFPDAEEKNE